MENKDLSKALKIRMEQPVVHIAAILVCFWGKGAIIWFPILSQFLKKKQPWKKGKNICAEEK